MWRWGETNTYLKIVMMDIIVDGARNTVHYSLDALFQEIIAKQCSVCKGMSGSNKH